MKKLQAVFLSCFLISAVGFAQKYTAEKSYISFYSNAAIEDITANNKKVSSIFDATTSDLVFSVPIEEFKFAKSLMREHFNEKYMESDKYPKATFAGKVTGYDPSRSGMQEAKAVGKLTIHGISKDVEIPGTLEKIGDKLQLKSKFIVKLADYKIEIPQLLWKNIAEQVEVTADFLYKPQ
jgi:polyisoprenoid-binding protein YceI